MGAQLKYGTVGATGGGWSSQPGTLQPSHSEDAAEPRWSWQQRSPRTRKDPQQWASLWPTSRFAGGGMGGGTDAMVIVGQGLECSGQFEPFSCDGDGCQGIKFVRGKVVDASDNAVPGATVQAFVTSTDVITGEATSKADGTYEVPSQYPGVNHYVVAYIAGSPDRGGTTVNTLVPANLDGS